MAKRTELMVAEDRAKVSELLAMGITSRSEMARIINSSRDERFHISASQVGKDIAKMEAEYLERGLENMEVYRHRAEMRLEHLLKVYYEAYIKSTIPKVTIESTKSIGDEDEYNELLNEPEMSQPNLAGMHSFTRDAKVKEEMRTEGNPALLSGIKAVLDSLHKLQGVDGTTKVALTDPSGTEEYLGIADMMKQQMAALRSREAPADIDKYLLDAAPKEEGEEEDFIEAEVQYEDE